MSKKRKEKRRQSPAQKSKAAQKKTMIIYYVAVIGFALAYHIISNQEWFMSLAEPIFRGYAHIGSAILNLFGEGAEAIGVAIRSPHFGLTIKEGCDAITPMILYSMAILAFPISFKLKWPGFILGILILFVLNIIRIISLYYIGKHFSYETFDFMHVDVWQVLFLIVTIFIWLLWMRWALITKSTSAQVPKDS